MYAHWLGASLIYSGCRHQGIELPDLCILLREFDGSNVRITPYF